MKTDWQPIDADPGSHQTLVPGIPEWMKIGFYQWIRDHCQLLGEDDPNQRLALAADFDMRSRNPRPIAQDATSYFIGNVLKQRADDALSLRFADYLLARFSDIGAVAADALRELLELAGSAYTVGARGSYDALEQRVPAGVREAYAATVTSSGTAGSLLAEAWRALFGQSPDYEEAYEKAIKAAEEAGAAEVAPRNKLTTLGTMARDMEAQGNWRLALIQNHKSPTDDVVTKMVRSLWEGQESRHGGNGYRKPTQEEAEAAVLLAVPLVQWFTSGAVQRR